MRYVLVTGVSTGIGNGIVEKLLEKGYHVFGSVRKDEDAEKCKEQFGEQFSPLIFDVTDRPAIENSVEIVQEKLGDSTLSGLINNAGYAVIGPLKDISVSEVRQQFEVNVLGVLNVTQVFLSLLGGCLDFTGKPGKIINISSVAGKIAYPFMGPYSASKHAVEAISDSLRRELQMYGIDVVVIEPGAIKTPIWTKDDDIDPYQKSDFYNQLNNFKLGAYKIYNKARPIDDVSNTIAMILEAKKTKTRYVISESWFSGWFLPRIMPDRLLDKGVARHLKIPVKKG